MYLYVEKEQGIAPVPEALMKVFGEPQFVMTLALKADRKLARVDRDEVEASIRDQGFFLQMPPGKESYMLDLYRSDAAG